MLRWRAFWMMRRSDGLFSGVGPPALTAIVISLPMRANALDILSQRANIVALRVSKIRPMFDPLNRERPPALAREHDPRRPDPGGSVEPHHVNCRRHRGATARTSVPAHDVL